MEYYIKRKLYDYFHEKEDRTGEEQYLMDRMKTELDFFDISAIHRDDLGDLMDDALGLNDMTMTRIAERMDRLYQSRGGFQDDKEKACEEMMLT